MAAYKILHGCVGGDISSWKTDTEADAVTTLGGPLLSCQHRKCCLFVQTHSWLIDSTSPGSHLASAVNGVKLLPKNAMALFFFFPLQWLNNYITGKTPEGGSIVQL